MARGVDGKTDMTTGSPYRLLVAFALPLMLGNVCQQLYTVTDTAVVGRAVGLGALAALGAVDWLNWLVLSIAQGMTQGFSILVAQNIGARDAEGVRRSVGGSVAIAVWLAAALTASAELLVVPAVRFLRVPGEIAPMAVLYLRVMYAGMPIVTAYNLAAALLRAHGDGRTPLVAMAIASVINIALDLLFVAVFRWGVAGAAAATLLAQAFSATFCIWRIRAMETMRLSKAHLRPNGGLVKRLLVLGAPMAMQNAVIAVGGMIVMSVVNSYPVPFIAGYTATNKLYGILEMAAVSFGYAMTTWAGQNTGAGKPERISSGIRAGLVLALLTSLVISAVMFAFGGAIVGAFVSPDEAGRESAVATAVRYLRLMSVCLPVLYVLHIVRSCIQGMGNTVVPMASGVAEFVVRTGGAMLLPRFIGETGVMAAEVAAWFGAVVILAPGYLLLRGRMNKTVDKAEKSL